MVTKDPFENDGILETISKSVSQIGVSTEVHFSRPFDSSVISVDVKKVYAGVGVCDRITNKVYGAAENIGIYGVCIGTAEIAKLRKLEECVSARPPQVEPALLENYKLFSGLAICGAVFLCR